MSLLRNPIKSHSKLLRGWLVAEAIALVFVIGFADYLTGYEVAFYPFYSIPILLLVWFRDTRSAILISLLCGVVWWAADAASGHEYTSEWFRIWETVVRMMFFCLIVLAGAGIRQQRDATKARIELLERSHNLEQEIISISERERQTIGQNLHDDLGQFLVAIGFAADTLKKNLEKESHPSAQAAGNIADLLNSAVIRTRQLARGISPVDQNEVGLELALDQLTFSASRLSGISCSFICDGRLEAHDNKRDLHLYRIAQEALNNAMKHAQAKVIVIALEVEKESLSLRISDDGKGFDPAGAGIQGMGLNIMQYRARTIGGTLEINPNSPAGTVVTCTIDGLGDNKSNSS